MPDDRLLSDFIANVAAPDRSASGGAVAAHTAALCGALTQLVSGITIGRKRYASVDAEMRAIAARSIELVTALSALADADADACADVRRAYNLPHETAQKATTQAKAIVSATRHATDVPLEIARRSAEACQLAATVAEKGNSVAVADVTVAALLAEASCRGAAYTVRLNVSALGDEALASRYVSEALDLARQAAMAATRAISRVERELAATAAAPADSPPQ